MQMQMVVLVHMAVLVVMVHMVGSAGSAGAHARGTGNKGTAPRLEMPGHFFLARGYLPDQHESLGGPGGQRQGASKKKPKKNKGQKKQSQKTTDRKGVLGEFLRLQRTFSSIFSESPPPSLWAPKVLGP
jgi:hypothetical protein